MERKTGKRGQLMGGLFTMLLFLVFILSALFTVLTGSRVYENITARSDKNFSSSTALSYIANKVRQGDRAGMTDIKEIEGTQVLELRQQIGGTDYVTWIYWLDGSIRELFTDTGSGLGLEDGLEILVCASFCVSVFAGADRLSRKADDLNHAVLAAQSLMEELKSGKREEELQTVWDKDWKAYTQREAAESGAVLAYEAEITVEMDDSMKQIRVDVTKRDKETDGTVIYSLEGSQYEP